MAGPCPARFSSLNGKEKEMQQTRQILLTLIATALVLVPAAMAAEYEFETLTAVSPGAANDINNRGQIVGSSGTNGYLIDGGTVTEIAYPGADSTTASSRR